MIDREYLYSSQSPTVDTRTTVLASFEVFFATLRFFCYSARLVPPPPRSHTPGARRVETRINFGLWFRWSHLHPPLVILLYTAVLLSAIPCTRFLLPWARICKPFYGAQESIPRYDNTICRTGPPCYIGRYRSESSESIPGLLKRLQLRALCPLFKEYATLTGGRELRRWLDTQIISYRSCVCVSWYKLDSKGDCWVGVGM